MWKFCGKAQFPHSFGRFTRNYVETVLFHKISTPGSQVKLRHFKQCYCEVFKSYSDLRLKLWFCKVVPFSKRVNQLIEYACYCSNDVLHNNIKKPSRFRSDNSRRKICIFFSFGQNLPFALPPSYQELRQMLFCERSTVSWCSKGEGVREYKLSCSVTVIEKMINKVI